MQQDMRSLYPLLDVCACVPAETGSAQAFCPDGCAFDGAWQQPQQPAAPCSGRRSPGGGGVFGPLQPRCGQHRTQKLPRSETASKQLDTHAQTIRPRQPGLPGAAGLCRVL